MNRALRFASSAALLVLLSRKPSINNDGVVLAATYRASLATGLIQATASSDQVAVSADGRFAAFRSRATNLAAEDTNINPDFFWIDLFNRVTRLVTINLTGTSSPGVFNGDSLSLLFISADGRYVVFMSDAPDYVSIPVTSQQIFRRDMVVGVTELVTVNQTGLAESAGSPVLTSISADARYIGFISDAADLVLGDANIWDDAYVRDMSVAAAAPGAYARISVDTGGGDANQPSYWVSLSADGRQAAFTSNATDLTPSVPGNLFNRIYYRNWMDALPATELVSVSTTGALADFHCEAPTISLDGNRIVFVANVTNLDPRPFGGIFMQQAYLRDRAAGTTRCVTYSPFLPQGANNHIFDAFLDSSGSIVVFRTGANNLAAGDKNSAEDAMVYYLDRDIFELMSVRTFGTQANSFSGGTTVAVGGPYAAFFSLADNLIDNDTNLSQDCFIRGPLK